jgi:alpha-galactosidase
METCQGFPGSIGHEKIDAQTFADWGIDYLKYDTCGDHRGKSARERYTKMSDALQATGRPIVFSICEWGVNQPWKWAQDVGHLWRTTGDIWPRWKEDGSKGWQNSVLSILDQQLGLYKYAGPGHWNDPDMLEVSNEELTNVESRAHFSLWAMLAAPLLTGNDLRSMPDSTRRILTNREVIAVNQDERGAQGRKVRDDGNQEVWVKPLAGGDHAVLLLNRWRESTTMETSAQQLDRMRELDLPEATRYRVRDLWAHKTETTGGEIEAQVPSHGVAVFRVSAAE